jgi:bacteriocin biosynthesis cyclodehydratase domain-containing protein
MPEALVVTAGAMGERTVELLEELGIVVSRCDANETFPPLDRKAVMVLAVDRPYPRVAEALDRASWASRVPWIAGVVTAHEFRVGPGIVPGATPCWACFVRRVRALAPDLRAHEAVERFASDGPTGPWFGGQLGALTEQAASILAAEASDLAHRAPPRTPYRMGHYWEGDAIFGLLRGRLYARIGVCPVCAGDEPEDATWARLARHFRERLLVTEP